MTSANTFMLGTYAGGIGGMTALNTLIENAGKPVDPENNFAEFTTPQELLDGSRRGAGFPSASWHYSSLNEAQLRAFRQICPGASAHVFVRLFVNDTSGGALVWHTYDAWMIWPSGERGKVAETRALDIQFQFRGLIQVE